MAHATGEPRPAHAAGQAGQSGQAGDVDPPQGSREKPSVLVWCALVIAFSPVLIDFALHVWERPWARGMLVFPWLVWQAARVDRPAAPPPRGRALLLGCVAAALLLQLMAVGGDAVRIARIGVVVAGAVALWSSGIAGVRTALLALWVLPVPQLLISVASPALESLVGQGAALLPGVALGGIAALDPHLAAHGARLPLEPVDGGVALYLGLAGVGWARAVLGGRSLPGAVRAAAGWALAGVPIQLGVVALAATGAVGFAGAEAARSLLDQASWLIVGAAALAAHPLRIALDVEKRSRGAGEALPC